MNTKKSRNLLGLMFFLLLFLVGTNSAFADEEHYINIIVGERPAGLGGAYTAVSDDTSALFYNPAGIVYSTEANLSVSTNAYYTSVKKYEDAIGSNSWTRQSATLLPNFFGIIQPLGPGVFGFSYVVPDSIYEDQDEVFNDVNSTVNLYTINFNQEDTTYNFGPSYAVQLGENFSAGVTLYYHSRRKQVINNQYQTLYNGRFQWTNVNLEIEEQGLRPLAGVMFSPKNGKYSLGAAVTTTYIHWTSALILSESKPAASSGATRSETFINEKRNMPVKYTLGIALFPSNELLFSFDYSHYSETSGNDLQIKKKAVNNFAVGVEYYFTEKFAFRGGFNTNFANTFDVGSEGSDDHIDMYALSASLTKFSRGTSLTLGTNYGFGNGSHSKGGIKGDANISSLLLYLGTSYSY